MKVRRIMFIFTICMLAGLVAWSWPSEVNVAQDELRTVESVDLERYVGLWCEIGKIPNRFQKKCVSGTTAFYSFRDDGQIDVVNRCIDKNDKPVRAVGVAKVDDAVTNSKLKVSFVSVLGQRLFWGDYWIIGLDPDYEYAVIGAPKRDYGWILSRRSELTAQQLEEVFATLRDQGYDPDAFVLTEQPSTR